MCNTFTLLQIVGIYLFPSDLESLSNNIFVEIISFLLFYDTWINFMINTLTGNSWSMLIIFYNNHLIHRWRIIYILFYTLLCWWFVLEFFFTFFFWIHTHLQLWKRLLSLLKIVGYLFVIWSQQPDVKERVLQQYLEYHGYAEWYKSPKPITLK